MQWGSIPRGLHIITCQNCRKIRWCSVCVWRELCNDYQCSLPTTCTCSGGRGHHALFDGSKLRCECSEVSAEVSGEYYEVTGEVSAWEQGRKVGGRAVHTFRNEGAERGEMWGCYGYLYIHWKWGSWSSLGWASNQWPGHCRLFPHTWLQAQGNSGAVRLLQLSPARTAGRLVEAP